ncbi:MAG: hypothetical protein ACRD1A_02850, partial [Terriglobales bacterium]
MQPTVSFRPTRTQRRLRDMLVAQPSWQSMTSVCKAAAVSPSTYYYWCHDPRFCEWLLADWSSALLMEGMHALNIARYCMTDSVQHLRIIVNLLFDPRGLAGLQAWRNAVPGLQSNSEPAQPLADENWTNSGSSATPRPAASASPAPPAKPPANIAYA